MRNQEEQRNGHIGIPSISAEALPWYLAVHTIITVYLSVTDTLFAPATQQITGWQEIQYAVVGEVSKAGGVALIASPVITEVSRVVIGAMWTKRKVEEAVQRKQAEWGSWNRRRPDAEARGKPFDEPPPNLENQTAKPSWESGNGIGRNMARKPEM